MTHAALRVLGRYPQLSARAVRALVLASVTPVGCIPGETENEAIRAQRHLSGFGRVDADRAEQSTDHRVVLLAEKRLLPDQGALLHGPGTPRILPAGAQGSQWRSRSTPRLGRLD